MGRVLGRAGAAALAAGLLAGCGQPAAELPAEVRERAEEQGAAPEMIYNVQLSGFVLAEQSAGVYGDDGYQSAYTSGGETAWLTVSRDTVADEADCTRLPVVAADGAGAVPAVACERDETGWYRTSGDRHEYVVVHDGHIVRLGAARGSVDRRTLAAAAHGAVPAAGTGERDPADTPSRTPTDRGDLPGHGDGAPLNGVDAGG